MSECVCVRECVRQPIVLSSEPPETTVGSALVHPPRPCCPIQQRL